jgi:hypothetical protein
MCHRNRGQGPQTIPIPTEKEAVVAKGDIFVVCGLVFCHHTKAHSHGLKKRQPDPLETPRGKVYLVLGKFLQIFCARMVAWLPHAFTRPNMNLTYRPILKKLYGSRAVKFVLNPLPVKN